LFRPLRPYRALPLPPTTRPPPSIPPRRQRLSGVYGRGPKTNARSDPTLKQVVPAGSRRVRVSAFIVGPRWCGSFISARTSGRDYVCRHARDESSPAAAVAPPNRRDNKLRPGRGQPNRTRCRCGYTESACQCVRVRQRYRKLKRNFREPGGVFALVCRRFISASGNRLFHPDTLIRFSWCSVRFGSQII